jgi:hypothetical protein
VPFDVGSGLALTSSLEGNVIPPVWLLSRLVICVVSQKGGLDPYNITCKYRFQGQEMYTYLLLTISTKLFAKVYCRVSSLI